MLAICGLAGYVQRLEAAFTRQGHLQACQRFQITAVNVCLGFDRGREMLCMSDESW